MAWAIICMNGYAAQTNIRALHLVIKNTEPNEIRKLINQAKDAGYNTIVLGIYNGVRFDSVKNPERAVRTWSKEEFVDVVEYAKSLQLEVVPEIKLLTHQEHLLKRSNPDYLFNSVTYDPRKLALYTTVVFPILDELVKLMHPKSILIGHDEVAGFNEYTRTKWLQPNEQILPANLFLEDVLQIHNYLKKLGIETWMWGDMLLSENEFPTMLGRHMHGNSLGYGKPLRVRLPHDIVICDWHYLDEQIEFPSVEALHKEGFQVLGATWEQSNTIRNFSHYAATHGAEGMIATTWSYVQRKKWDVVGSIIHESGVAFSKDFPDAR